MEGNLAVALAARAQELGWRDRPLYYSGDAVVSHGEVHDSGARAAGVLHAVGVRTGDRVLIALPDSLAFVSAFLGTLRLGAVAVLAGPEQAEPEHAYLVDDAGPAVAVCTRALAPRFASLLDSTRASRPASSGPAFPGPASIGPASRGPASMRPASSARSASMRPISTRPVPMRPISMRSASARSGPARVLTEDDLAAEPATIPERVPVPPDASAYVQYTSGTTGRPKGAVHRHGDAYAYYHAMALGALELTPGDLTFSLSKACYPFGLGATVLFPMLSGSAAVLWPDQPSVRGAVEQARAHRPSLLFTVPTWYARLVSAPDRNAVRVAFASLRAAVSAGEPLLPTLADRAEEILGCPVLDGLGSTEAGHTFVSNTVGRRRRGALGVVLAPYEIEIRTGAGAAAPGETGALYVRGPSIMAGYLGRPEKTAEVLAADGWLRTGDLVHVDAAGFVHHHGRIHDRVRVSGEQVQPLEVERVLGQHPGVVEVAVVATGGPAASRRALRAFVVTEAGLAATAALERELLDLAARRLPPHKVPRSVTFLDELPRTSTGKIRRSSLG
ncbi:AMP-binding protein [Actinomadura roseirufa]|uniref:AMP-binding protein n=1 Tax=Actinomadura roseirufa TaxID=2094049 RepID=UPI001040E80F|nr:AMP-binding protein [Actinomadura roseirufa]